VKLPRHCNPAFEHDAKAVDIFAVDFCITNDCTRNADAEDHQEKGMYNGNLQSEYLAKPSSSRWLQPRT
jgi:hypothetical protein